MAFLTRLLARRQVPLPQFDLAPLAFELQHPAQEGEFVLDRPLTDFDGHANVIALPGAARTPGELRESIERHLRISSDDDAPLLAQDAVDELREALAELRRSLG
jgi:hypothetical protein